MVKKIVPIVSATLILVCIICTALYFARKHATEEEWVPGVYFLPGDISVFSTSDDAYFQIPCVVVGPEYQKKIEEQVLILTAKLQANMGLPLTYEIYSRQNFPHFTLLGLNMKINGMPGNSYYFEQIATLDPKSNAYTLQNIGNANITYLAKSDDGSLGSEGDIYFPASNHCDGITYAIYNASENTINILDISLDTPREALEQMQLVLINGDDEHSLPADYPVILGPNQSIQVYAKFRFSSQTTPCFIFVSPQIEYSVESKEGAGTSTHIVSSRFGASEMLYNLERIIAEDASTEPIKTFIQMKTEETAK